MFTKIQEIIIQNNDLESLFLNIEPGTFGSSYVQSYKSIKGFFNHFALNEDSLIQGSHMVYGWMPTILNITKYELDTKNVVSILKGMSIEINETSLNVISNFMNNSVVGASKLLHFIYPEKYPIWDSKICEIITTKSYHQKVQNTQNYLMYFDAIQNLIVEDHGNLKKFKKKFEDKFNYEISMVRAAELMIFLSSSANKNDN